MMDWVEQAKQIGIVLSLQQQAQFEIYLSLLLAWNQKMNLTAVREPAAIRQRHFVDSLSCAMVMSNLNGKTVIDVGTGAGFPGIPLKILYPHMQLTLVESIQKKAKFLEVVVAELALADVSILSERAEVLGQHPAHRDQYDWAVARAVAELRILVEYLIPFCCVGGQICAQKGAIAKDELDKAGLAIRKLGGGNPKIKAVQLPAQQEKRYLVTMDKIAETPQHYPRRVGVPGKRPL
ncbi:MAG: 16S rRNA (guanine(527)-N(7))-methyltransferase RsmG [Chloroflexi bacterium]|nr:16S rRNA (guanine(527)-N(7))-methyltransferase RsmG [Chloroflexota bacterium]